MTQSEDLPEDIHHALELLWSSTIIRNCADGQSSATRISDQGYSLRRNLPSVRLQDCTPVVPVDCPLFRIEDMLRVISPATSEEGTLVDSELSDWRTCCEPKIAPSWGQPASTLDSSQLLLTDFVAENADAPIRQMVSSYLEAMMSSQYLPTVLSNCPSDDAVEGYPRDEFELHPDDPADGSGDVKSTSSEQDAIEATQMEKPQMQNTLAACRSRKRKLDDQRDLATTIEETEMWTQRAMRLKALSERQGQPVHQRALRTPVEREKEEIETWRQQAMESQLWLESQGFGHESEASSSELA